MTKVAVVAICLFLALVLDGVNTLSSVLFALAAGWALEYLGQTKGGQT